MPTLQFNLEDRSPFDQKLEISKGARLPALEIQLFDGTAKVDLTGAAVKFSMDDENGKNKVNAVAATLDGDPTSGKVSYAWAAADVDTVGKFFGQFLITISNKDHLIPNNDTQRLLIIISDKIN